jgi:hypothetical protein
LWLVDLLNEFNDFVFVLVGVGKVDELEQGWEDVDESKFGKSFYEGEVLVDLSKKDENSG